MEPEFRQLNLFYQQEILQSTRALDLPLNRQ